MDESQSIIETPNFVLFWRNIAADFPDGCWLWKGWKNSQGYGKLRPYKSVRKNQKAHRFSYEQFRGQIPDGFEVDHLCKNPSCVHPYHLEAVTHRENCIRGESPPAYNARRTHCTHGHVLDGDNLIIVKRHDKEGGSRFHRRCRQCRNKDERNRKKRSDYNEMRRHSRMAKMSIHFLRHITGRPDAQWVHCGRPLEKVKATTVLADVTCKMCQGYITKGLAYGFRQNA